jgi:hypothetical protein
MSAHLSFEEATKIYLEKNPGVTRICQGSEDYKNILDMMKATGWEEPPLVVIPEEPRFVSGWENRQPLNKPPAPLRTKLHLSKNQWLDSNPKFRAKFNAHMSNLIIPSEYKDGTKDPRAEGSNDGEIKSRQGSKSQGKS